MFLVMGPEHDTSVEAAALPASASWQQGLWRRRWLEHLQQDKVPGSDDHDLYMSLKKDVNLGL